MSTLAETRAAILSAGLSWEAGTTPIGHDFAVGKLKGFGLAPRGREPSGGRGNLPRQSFAFTTGGPPTEVDWRRVNDRNFVTQVEDQGRCGACVAFATCAVLESRVLIEKDDAHYDINLSKAHLFFCGTINGCEEGWQPGSALKRCRDKGVGRAGDFRYAAARPYARKSPRS